MRDRFLRLCTRSIPRERRHAHGAAVVDLAAEMVENRRSSTAREAFGILRFGLRQRLAHTKSQFADLPWAEAMWTLAAPVTAAQFAVFLLALPPDVFADGAGIGMNLGSWWTSFLIASGVSLMAAVRQNRMLLGMGATAVFALAVLDTWGPGGSMLGHTSHGVNLGSSNWILSPAVLFLLPVTMLTMLVPLWRLPVRPTADARSRSIGLTATLAAPGFALALTYGRVVGGGDLPESFLWLSFGENGYLNMAASAIGAALVLTMLFRGVSKPTAFLAAALLIASQIPLLSLLTMFETASRFTNFYSAIPLPGLIVPLLAPVMITITLAALLTAVVFVRFRSSATSDDGLA